MTKATTATPAKVHAAIDPAIPQKIATCFSAIATARAAADVRRGELDKQEEQQAADEAELRTLNKSLDPMDDKGVLRAAMLKVRLEHWPASLFEARRLVTVAEAPIARYESEILENLSKAAKQIAEYHRDKITAALVKLTDPQFAQWAADHAPTVSDALYLSWHVGEAQAQLNVSLEELAQAILGGLPPRLVRPGQRPGDLLALIGNQPAFASGH